MLSVPVNHRDCRDEISEQVYFRDVLEAVGKWLNENSGREELVFTETVGYIGYFSGNRMVDYPGLVSPEVPALVNGRSPREAYDLVISTFEPAFIAVRTNEWDGLSKEIRDSYRVTAEFPPPPTVNPVRMGFVIATRLD
jgi:hypothetical protein